MQNIRNPRDSALLLTGFWKLGVMLGGASKAGSLRSCFSWSGETLLRSTSDIAVRKFC